jgi:cytoskeletal protein CcmA (bactofilin family)
MRVESTHGETNRVHQKQSHFRRIQWLPGAGNESAWRPAIYRKLHLDGDFHGTITTDDVLVVGEQATIEADIKAGEVLISGKVFGNIECARRVEINASGHFRGDVRTPKFVINEGGIFEGKSLAAENHDSRESLWEPDKTVDSVVETSTK